MRVRAGSCARIDKNAYRLATIATWHFLYHIFAGKQTDLNWKFFDISLRLPLWAAHKQEEPCTRFDHYAIKCSIHVTHAVFRWILFTLKFFVNLKWQRADWRLVRFKTIGYMLYLIFGENEKIRQMSNKRSLILSVQFSNVVDTRTHTRNQMYNLQWIRTASQWPNGRFVVCVFKLCKQVMHQMTFKIDRK